MMIEQFPTTMDTRWPNHWLPDPSTIIASGVSADLHNLGDGRVIKLFRPAVSDDMIAREAAMSTDAYRRNLPAAPALARGDVGGLRGILYPHVAGGTMMQWIRKHPLRAGQAIDRMARAQASIHRAGGGDGRRLKDVIATDIAYGPAPLALQRAAIDRLTTLPHGDALLHGDYHLGNIMIGPQGLTVIDWSKGAVGHPAADVARTEMLMRFGIGPDDWITNLWRDWAARRFTRTYLAASTISQADIDIYRPFVALAWLRARSAGRNRAFAHYLNDSLLRAGLPLLD